VQEARLDKNWQNSFVKVPGALISRPELLPALKIEFASASRGFLGALRQSRGFQDAENKVGIGR
jgi:hypothetical protein